VSLDTAAVLPGSLHVKSMQAVRLITPRQTEWHTKAEAAARAVTPTSCHRSKEATKMSTMWDTRSGVKERLEEAQDKPCGGTEAAGGYKFYMHSVGA
jgi:hypothetical protein